LQRVRTPPPTPNFGGTMKYSWVVIAWTDPELEDRITRSDYFKVKENPGFLKPLGIPSPRAYRPWVINPAIDVWQEIQRKINRETKGSAKGRSSVLDLKDEDGQAERRYVFTLRFYRPGTICIEVSLQNDIGATVEEWFRYRNLSEHKSAAVVVDCLIGIVRTGDIKEYPVNNSFFSKTAMLIPVEMSSEEFATWKNENRPQIAGLLINNHNYDVASPELTEKIFARNKELDIKYAKSAFSMISKQGVLTSFAVSSPQFINDISREHLKRFRFLEYASVLQKLVEQVPLIRRHDEDVADFLLYLSIPFLDEKANLAKTVTGTNTWQILAQEFGLQRSFESLEKPLIEAVEAKTKYFLTIPQSAFDALDYSGHIKSATKAHTKGWISKDFAGNKIIVFVVTTALTIVGLIIAAVRFWPKI